MQENLNFETCSERDIAQFVANNPQLFAESATEGKVEALMAPSVELFRHPTGFAYVHRTPKSGRVLWYIYSTAKGTARSLVQHIREQSSSESLALLCRGEERRDIFQQLGFVENTAWDDGDYAMTAPPLKQS